MMHVNISFMYYFYLISLSLLDDRFPIAWIDDWASFFNDPYLEDNLNKWIKDLGPYYEAGSEMRNKVLKMLTSEYWHSQMTQKYIEYHEKKNTTLLK